MPPPVVDPRDVDQVLHGEGEAVEPTAPGRFAGCIAAGNERAVGLPAVVDHGHVAEGGRLHQRAPTTRRAEIIAFESVTKPKHFFTFQIVASVQKSGEVVAQQSDQHAAVAEEIRVGQRMQHALIGVDAGEQDRAGAEVAQDAVERRVPEAADPVLVDLDVVWSCSSSSTTAAAQESFSSTGAPLPGSGSPRPMPMPFGL